MTQLITKNQYKTNTNTANSGKGKHMNLLTHSRKRKSALKIFSILMTAILIFSPGGLLAGSLPSGQSVVKGKVTITTNGNVMDIDQASQKAIVNWQKFNIGEGYTVNVNQINKTAAMLARVIGNDPSKILGNLNATGHFYLINQNGIFFGQNARINVGALIASTMDIKDDDFMAGQLNFFGESTASVINAGQINADAVALLGKDVQNLGTINANQVGLVAAQKAVTLGDFGGGAKLIVDFSDFDKATDAAVETSIVNKGIVNAGEDGDVVLFAEAGTASNEEGYVKADSLEISGDFVDLNKLGNFDVNNLLIDPTGTLTILDFIMPIIDNGNVDWNDGYTGNDGDQTISENHLNDLATGTNLTLMFDNFVLNTILDITASPGRTLTFSTNNYAAGDGTFDFNNKRINSVQNVVINAGSIGGNAIIKTPDNNCQDVTLNVYNGFTVGADGKVITLTSTTGFINSLDGADWLNASEELRLNAKTGMKIVSVSPIISVGDSDGDITIDNNILTNNTSYLRLRALDGNDINAASFSLRNYNDVLIENAIDITGALSIEAQSSNIAGDIVSSNPSAVAGQNNSVGDIGIMATIRAGSITLDADGIVITSSLPAEAATLTATTGDLNIIARNVWSKTNAIDLNNALIAAERIILIKQTIANNDIGAIVGSAAATMTAGTGIDIANQASDGAGDINLAGAMESTSDDIEIYAQRGNVDLADTATINAEAGSIAIQNNFGNIDVKSDEITATAGAISISTDRGSIDLGNGGATDTVTAGTNISIIANNNQLGEDNHIAIDAVLDAQGDIDINFTGDVAGAITSTDASTMIAGDVVTVFNQNGNIALDSDVITAGYNVIVTAANGEINGLGNEFTDVVTAENGYIDIQAAGNTHTNAQMLAANGIDITAGYSAFITGDGTTTTAQTTSGNIVVDSVNRNININDAIFSAAKTADNNDGIVDLRANTNIVAANTVITAEQILAQTVHGAIDIAGSFTAQNELVFDARTTFVLNGEDSVMESIENDAYLKAMDMDFYGKLKTLAGNIYIIDRANDNVGINIGGERPALNAAGPLTIDAADFANFETGDNAIIIGRGKEYVGNAQTNYTVWNSAVTRNASAEINDFATTNDVITQVGDATTDALNLDIITTNAITRNDGYLTFSRDGVNLALVANKGIEFGATANTNLNLAAQNQPGSMFAEGNDQGDALNDIKLHLGGDGKTYNITGFTAGIDLVADVIAQDITGIINSANGRDILVLMTGTDNTLNILQTIVGTAGPSTNAPATDRLADILFHMPGNDIVQEHLADVIAQDGDVVAVLRNWDIARVQALAGTVAIINSGSIRDNNDIACENDNIIADALFISAMETVGQGNPLETDVNRIQMKVNEDVSIVNAKDLIIGGVRVNFDGEVLRTLGDPDIEDTPTREAFEDKYDIGKYGIWQTAGDTHVSVGIHRLTVKDIVAQVADSASGKWADVDLTATYGGNVTFVGAEVNLNADIVTGAVDGEGGNISLIPAYEYTNITVMGYNKDQVDAAETELGRSWIIDSNYLAHLITDGGVTFGGKDHTGTLTFKVGAEDHVNMQSDVSSWTFNAGNTVIDAAVMFDEADTLNILANGNITSNWNEGNVVTVGTANLTAMGGIDLFSSIGNLNLVNKLNAAGANNGIFVLNAFDGAQVTVINSDLAVVDITNLGGMVVYEASNLGGELWMQVDDGNLVAEYALLQALDINLASTGSVEILSASLLANSITVNADEGVIITDSFLQADGSVTLSGAELGVTVDPSTISAGTGDVAVNSDFIVAGDTKVISSQGDVLFAGAVTIAGGDLEATANVGDVVFGGTVDGTLGSLDVFAGKVAQFSDTVNVAGSIDIDAAATFLMGDTTAGADITIIGENLQIGGIGPNDPAVTVLSGAGVGFSTIDLSGVASTLITKDVTIDTDKRGVVKLGRINSDSDEETEKLTVGSKETADLLRTEIQLFGDIRATGGIELFGNTTIMSDILLSGGEAGDVVIGDEDYTATTPDGAHTYISNMLLGTYDLTIRAANIKVYGSAELKSLDAYATGILQDVDGDGDWDPVDPTAGDFAFEGVKIRIYEDLNLAANGSITLNNYQNVGESNNSIEVGGDALIKAGNSIFVANNLRTIGDLDLFGGEAVDLGGLTKAETGDIDIQVRNGGFTAVKNIIATEGSIDITAAEAVNLGATAVGNVPAEPVSIFAGDKIAIRGSEVTDAAGTTITAGEEGIQIKAVTGSIILDEAAITTTGVVELQAAADIIATGFTGDVTNAIVNAGEKATITVAEDLINATIKAVEADVIAANIISGTITTSGNTTAMAQKTAFNDAGKEVTVLGDIVDLVIDAGSVVSADGVGAGIVAANLLGSRIFANDGNIIADIEQKIDGTIIEASANATITAASLVASDLITELGDITATITDLISDGSMTARAGSVNVTAAQVANSELTALTGTTTIVADGVGNTNIAADSVVLGKEGMTLLDVDITADDVTSNDKVLGNIVNGNWTIGNNVDIAANVISGIIADADRATITATVIENAQFKANDGITATVATAIIGSTFTAEHGNILLRGADATASIANTDIISARGDITLRNFANIDTVDATAGGKIGAASNIGNVIGGTWTATGNISVGSALISGTSFDAHIVTLKATGDIENASVKATRYAWLDTRADGNGGSVINTIVTGKGTGTSNGIVVYADQDVKGLIATADTASISVQTTNGSIEGSTLIAENIAVLKAGTNILDNSITATGTDATMIVAGTNADLALIDGNVITVGGPLTLNGSDRAYVTDNTIGAVGNLTVRNVLGSSANTYTTNGNFSFNSADANTVNDLITATGAATIDANIVSGLKLDSGDIATINAALIENSAIKANDDAAVTSNSNIFNTVVKAAGAATITATEGRINALDVSANEATITAGGKISASNVDVAKSVVLTAGGELDGNTVTADGVGLAEVTDLAIDATGTWIVGGEYIAEYGSIKMTATTGSIVGTVVTAKAEDANVEMNAALGELDDNTVVNIGDIIIAAYGVTSGAYISEQGKIIIATSGEDISGVYAKSKTQSVELYAGYVNDGAGGYVATDVALDVIDSVADAHTFATIMATGNIKNAAAVSATDDATMIAAGNITSGVVNGYAFNVEAANIAGLSASSFGEDIADGKNVIKAATITGATASAIGDVTFDGTVANSDANVQAGDVTFKNGALTDVNAAAATGNIIATENIAWVTGGNFRAAGDVTVDSASSITDLAAEGANVFVTALTYIDGLNASARGDVLNVTAAQVANSELTALIGTTTIVADGVGNTNIAADSVVLGKEGMTLLDVDITADDVTSNDMVLGNIVNGNWTIGNNMDIAANVISGIIADADIATITATVIEDAQFKTNDGITATVATAIIGSSFIAENGNVTLSGADETASIANSDAIAARGNVGLANFANVDTINATAGGAITATEAIGNVIGGTWTATGDITVSSALISGTAFDGAAVELTTTSNVENASVKATGNATITAANIGNSVIGAANGNATLTAADGQIVGNTITAAGTADIDAAFLTNNIVGAGTIDVDATTTIAGGTYTAAGNANLNAVIDIDGVTVVAGSADVFAGRDLKNSRISGMAHVNATAGNVANVDIVSAAGSVALTAEANVATSAITAAGNVTVNAGDQIAGTTITTAGAATLAADNITNNIVAATGDLRATATTSVVGGTYTTAGIASVAGAYVGSLTVAASGNATITSGSDVENAAVRGAIVNVTAADNVANVDIVSTAASVLTATAGNITGSAVTAGTTADLTAGNEIDGTDVTAGTDITVLARKLAASSFVSETGAITVGNANRLVEDIIDTTIWAKSKDAGTVEVTASNEIDGTTITAGSDLTVTAGYLAASALISETGKITATAGLIDATSLLAKDGAITASATGITGNSSFTANAISAGSTGNVTLLGIEGTDGSIVANAAITAAGNVAISGFNNVDSLDITAGGRITAMEGIDNIIAGEWIATGNITVTSALISGTAFDGDIVRLTAPGNIENASVKATKYAWLDTRTADGTGGSVLNTVVTGKGVGSTNGVIVYADQDVKGLTATADTASISVQTTNGSIEGSTLIAENIAVLKAGTNILDNSITATGTDATTIVAGTNADLALIDGNVITVGGPLTLNGSDRAYVTDNTIGAVGNLTVRNVLGSSANTYTTNGNFRFNSADANTVNDLITATGAATIDANIVSGLKLDSGDIATINAALIENSAIKANDDAAVTSNSNIFNTVVKAAGAATIAAVTGRINALDVSANEATITAGGKISASNVDVAKSVVLTAGGELDGNTVTADGVGLADVTDLAIDAEGTWIVGGEYVAEYGSIEMTATTGSIVGTVVTAKAEGANINMYAALGELDDNTVVNIGDIIIEAHGVTAGAYISEEGRIVIATSGEDISGVYAKSKTQSVELLAGYESSPAGYVPGNLALDVIDSVADAHTFATIMATGSIKNAAAISATGNATMTAAGNITTGVVSGYDFNVTATNIAGLSASSFGDTIADGKNVITAATITGATASAIGDVTFDGTVANSDANVQTGDVVFRNGALTDVNAATAAGGIIATGNIAWVTGGNFRATGDVTVTSANSVTDLAAEGANVFVTANTYIDGLDAIAKGDILNVIAAQIANSELTAVNGEATIVTDAIGNTNVVADSVVLDKDGMTLLDVDVTANDVTSGDWILGNIVNGNWTIGNDMTIAANVISGIIADADSATINATVIENAQFKTNDGIAATVGTAIIGSSFTAENGNVLLSGADATASIANSDAIAARGNVVLSNFANVDTVDATAGGRITANAGIGNVIGGTWTATGNITVGSALISGTAFDGDAVNLKTTGDIENASVKATRYAWLDTRTADGTGGSVLNTVVTAKGVGSTNGVIVYADQDVKGLTATADTASLFVQTTNGSIEGSTLIAENIAKLSAGSNILDNSITATGTAATTIVAGTNAGIEQALIDGNVVTVGGTLVLDGSGKTLVSDNTIGAVGNLTVRNVLGSVANTYTTGGNFVFNSADANTVNDTVTATGNATITAGIVSELSVDAGGYAFITARRLELSDVKANDNVRIAADEVAGNSILSETGLVNVAAEANVATNAITAAGNVTVNAGGQIAGNTITTAGAATLAADNITNNNVSASGSLIATATTSVVGGTYTTAEAARITGAYVGSVTIAASGNATIASGTAVENAVVRGVDVRVLAEDNVENLDAKATGFAWIESSTGSVIGADIVANGVGATNGVVVKAYQDVIGLGATATTAGVNILAETGSITGSDANAATTAVLTAGNEIDGTDVTAGTDITIVAKKLAADSFVSEGGKITITGVEDIVDTTIWAKSLDAGIVEVTASNEIDGTTITAGSDLTVTAGYLAASALVSEAGKVTATANLVDASSFLAKDGEILATATAITGNSSFTANAIDTGNVTLTGTPDADTVIANAAITARGDATVSGFGNVDSLDVVANGKIVATEGIGNVIGGTWTSTGTTEIAADIVDGINLNADGATIVARQAINNAITSGADTTITAAQLLDNNTIMVDGVLTLDGAAALTDNTITTTGNLDITAAAFTAGNTFTTAGSFNVDIAGNMTNDTVTATGDATIAANFVSGLQLDADSATINALANVENASIKANDDATVTAINIGNSNIAAANGVATLTAEGHIIANTVTAAGGATLEADLLTNNIVAGATIDAMAATTIAGGTYTAADNATLTAAVDIDGVTVVAGSADVFAGRDLKNSRISGMAHVNATAGNVANVDIVSAAGSVALTAEANVATSAITAAGNVTVNAGDQIAGTTITTAGAATLAADNITNNIVAATGDLRATATTSVVGGTYTTAGIASVAGAYVGSLTVAASGNATITSGSDVENAAVRGAIVNVTAADNVANVDIVSTAGSVLTATAGNITGSAVAAGTTADLTAGNEIDGTDVTAGTDIAVAARKLAEDSFVSEAGKITITGVEDIVNSTIWAKGKDSGIVEVTATNEIDGTTIVAGSDLTVNAGYLADSAFISEAGKVTATAGLIDASSFLAKDGEILATATAITGNSSFTANAIDTGTGNVTLTGTPDAATVIANAAITARGDATVSGFDNVDSLDVVANGKIVATEGIGNVIGGTWTSTGTTEIAADIVDGINLNADGATIVARQAINNAITSSADTTITASQYLDNNRITVVGVLTLDGAAGLTDNTISTTGDLGITAAAFTAGNTFTTAGSFNVDIAGNMTNDTVTATGNATITAGIVSELSLDTGGNATVAAHRLELSDVKANDNVIITADEVAGNGIVSETGTVTIEAAANVATNAITATGDVTIDADEQIAGNTITTDGAATLTARDITNNNVASTGDLSAAATTSVVGGTYTTAGAATVTGAYVGSLTVAASGDATITSGSDVENAAVRGAIVNVTAARNVANVDIVSTDASVLTATAGNITGSSVAAGTTAGLTAGNEIDGTDVTAGTDITVVARKLAADSFVSEGGKITITGVEDIVNSTIWAKSLDAGIVEVTATNEIDGTTIVAGADLTVNAGYLVASDLISEAGDIAATAETLISDGSMTAKIGSIAANAAEVAGTGFSAGQDVAVTAATIAGTGILAGRNVTLDGTDNAAGSIANNSVSNSGDVAITNAERVDNNTVATAGSITVSNVQVLSGGEYVASNAINLGAENNKLNHIVDASFTGDSLAAFVTYDFTGNTVLADSSAEVDAGNAIINNRIVVNSGDAKLTAANFLATNTITVSGTLTLDGAAPVVSNTIDTFGDITITAAAYTANNTIDTAGAFTIDIDGDMTNDLVTAAGAAAIDANLVSGLQLDAASAAIAAAANVENATVKTDGSATIDAVNVIGTIVTAASGDVAIAATADVENVDISGAGVKVEAGNILTSNIVASGNALLTAVNSIDGVTATAGSFIDATPGNDFTIENFLLDTVDGVENQTVAGSGDATGNAGITAVRIDNSQFTSAGDIDAKATDAVAATSFIGKDIKVHAANDVAGVDIASFGNVVLTAKENNITGTQVTATQWIDVRAGNEIDNSGFTAAAKDGAWNPASETKANGKQDAITVLAKYVAESGFIAEDGNITAGTETEDDENILHAVGNTFWAKKGIVEIDVEGELDSNNIVGHDGIDIEAGYIVGATLVAENGLLQVSASEALADSNIINKNGDILVYNTDAIINTNITALDVPADEEAAGGFEAYMGGDVFIDGDGDTTIVDSAIHGADDVQIIASAIDNTNIRAENAYEGAADADTIAGMTDIDGITITASAIDASTLDADKVTIDALDEIVNIGRDGEVVINGAEEITIGDADRIDIVSNNDNDVLMTISEADTTAGVIDIAQNGEGNLDLDIVAKLATLNLEADKNADVDGNIAEINAIVGGNLDITDADDIVLGENVANGAVVAENATGDITVEDVKSDKSVAITATEGSIVDGNADNENANITAPEVTLTAGTNVGAEDDSLDTATRKLTAEAIEGSINIDNTSNRKTEVAELKAKEDIAFTQHGSGDAVITGDIIAENGDVAIDSTDGANIKQQSNSGVIEATNGNVTIATSNGGDVVIDEVIAKDIVAIDADGAVLRADTEYEDGTEDVTDIIAATVFIKATDGIGQISFDEAGNVATDQFINISGAGRIELDTTGDNADIGVEIRNGAYVRYEARTEGNDSDIYTNVSDTYALYLNDVVAKDGDVVIGAEITHVFANHVRALDDGMINELENDAHSVIIRAYSLDVADEGIKADYNGVITTAKDVDLGERTIEVGNDVNIHAGGDILSDGGPDQINIISGGDINLKVGGVIGNVPGNRPVTVDAGGQLHVDSDGSDNNGRGKGFIWVYMNGTTVDGKIHYDGKPNYEPGIIYWNGRVWGGNSHPVNRVSRSEGEFNSNLRNILDGYTGKWWATNTFQYFPHVRMMMDLKPQDMSIEHILNGRGTIENLPEGVGPDVIDINSLDDTFSWYQGDEWNW